jgi:hypothetical protein
LSLYERTLAFYPRFTRRDILWKIPLAELFLLYTASEIRAGRQLPGATYRDMDLIDLLAPPIAINAR